MSAPIAIDSRVAIGGHTLQRLLLIGNLMASHLQLADDPTGRELATQWEALQEQLVTRLGLRRRLPAGGAE